MTELEFSPYQNLARAVIHSGLQALKDTGIEKSALTGSCSAPVRRCQPGLQPRTWISARFAERRHRGLGDGLDAH